jgi:hypothetical protein
MRGLIPVLLLSALPVGVVGLASAQTPPAAVHAAYAVEPFTPTAPITINGTGVRLRAEPFATKDTQVLSSGSTGLALNVIGLARQPDWNWYQVVLKNGQKAFIRSDLTSAPSRGGGTSASPVSLTPAAPLPPVTPAPVVSTTPTYQPPAYQPPTPVSQPSAPAWQPPAPAAGSPAPPIGPPISLTPKSPPPPDAWLPPSKEADTSGLLSNPPNQ